MNIWIHKRRTLLLFATISLTLLLFVSTPVIASNFGSTGSPGTIGTTNGVWLTNNSTFNVYKRSLTSTYAAGVDDTIDNDYDTIPGWVATAFTATSCDDTGADVCVFDFDYGNNGLLGWNACAGTTSGSHPNQQCSVSWVKINENYSPPATTIACHELAHATGLRHTSSSSSCVNTVVNSSTSKRLSSHDRNHLETEY